MTVSLTELYDRLYARYGDLNWWPAKNPYEVMVGAVLTQNTNWANVEKAIRSFGDQLSPEFVESLPPDELTGYIRPAGFFNQKAGYLKALTAWYKGYNYNVDDVRKRPAESLRPELLAVSGVGRETADSIMLYAFGYPEFVADAYTVRLLERLGEETAARAGYEGVKAFFQSRLPADAALYNNFHAAIVINGKTHCHKKPVCEGCPLIEICVK